MHSVFEPLTLNRGPSLKNRFMLAPLTNQQSHADGRCSDDEFNCLVKRAEGGFGLTMTCAAHVQEHGKGFSGQLGIFDDKHIDGLSKLASAIKKNDSVAIAQLYHGGMRSPKDVTGVQPVSCTDNDKYGAREMTTDEVKVAIDAFSVAAQRAEEAGFHGVELHGAHGYLLAQFLSPELNTRTDEYGGTMLNRHRIVFEIIEAIRKNCGNDFIIGLRISSERFGLDMKEILGLVETIFSEELVEFLDVSMWDVFKTAEQKGFSPKSLMSIFTELDRKNVRLGAAGKIMTADDVNRAMQSGLDWVMLGRAAILHHNYPYLMKKDPNFAPVDTPVSSEYLKNEGLGPAFIEYMTAWKDFVKGSEGFVDFESLSAEKISWPGKN